ncbi:MAG: anti-sigma factor [Verrucomicrobiota bacterium]|jgi:anti-sigma factor RsiW
MNCEHAKPLIGPSADGELDASAVLDLEKHFHGCPACALEWRNARGLKKALKQSSLFFAAPKELRRRVKADLHLPSETRFQRHFPNWNWLAPASVGAAIACLAMLMTAAFTRPAAQPRLAQDIVSSHVRSLMANHMLDVVSADQHTVKPWFNGKLDFSPPVRNLAGQEFPLIGGRLDYLGGRSVAALVFQRHKHVINLFIWPAKEKDSKPASIARIQGYNLVGWSDAEMTFWAVSDLNESELTEFVQDYATAAPPK